MNILDGLREMTDGVEARGVKPAKLVLGAEFHRLLVREVEQDFPGSALHEVLGLSPGAIKVLK